MGVTKYTISPGNGVFPQKDDVVLIFYIQRQENGPELKRDMLKTTLGSEEVTVGWDEKILQMSLGEKANFIITPDDECNELNPVLILEINLLQINLLQINTEKPLKKSKLLLQHWLEGHMQHPYPTDDEKQRIQAQTGWTIVKINDWFTDQVLSYNIKSKKILSLEESKSLLQSWLNGHMQHPYPTDDEKRMFWTQTGWTIVKINRWFMEARKSISQVLRCWLNGHTQGQSPTKDEMSMLMEMTGLKMSQINTWLVRARGSHRCRLVAPSGQNLDDEATLDNENSIIAGDNVSERERDDAISSEVIYGLGAGFHRLRQKQGSGPDHVQHGRIAKVQCPQLPKIWSDGNEEKVIIDIDKVAGAPSLVIDLTNDD